jgi:PAS domain S-box-containing protein
MGELLGNKKSRLKELIRALHAGARPDEMKERFKEVLEDVGPLEIAKVEQELIKEGMPAEEVRRLCDVHLVVFKESLEREKTLAPAGHPIHILTEEHKIISQTADELKNLAQKIKEAGDFSSIATEMVQLGHIEEHLKDSESHHIREENVLFPYLEKHGVTQPPAIMWMEHDEIREVKKNLYKLIDTLDSVLFPDFAKQLEEIAISLADLVPNHIYKENNVLYPTALKVITENEWKDVRKQFDELGYCCFTPESAKGVAEELEMPAPGTSVEGKILFKIGDLSKEELEAMLNTLPVDITFVDKKDIVRYFSQPKERLFPRAKAVIGRKVQQCHPQKSVHLVNQILDDFKSGKRDSAEFWIDAKGRKIYIRYFAVRDSSGRYLGCVEATQDITAIQKLKGEKRLLETS